MDSKISEFKFNGLTSAPFTCFSADGGVDYDSIPFHAAELARTGVRYAFVNGTTGEGYSLSLAERRKVIEAWVVAGKKYGVVVVAMVTAESIVDSVELAAHAVAAGVAAIGYQPSTFFKPEGVAGVVELLAAVGAAAPSLPLYYYHIFVKTAVMVRCDHLLDAVVEAQAAGKLANFRGIKYSNADLYVMSNCIAAHGGRFDIAYGMDEQLLGALALGAVGAVGSTYNYTGKLANAIIAAFNKGDVVLARKLQRGTQILVNFLHQSTRYGPAGCNVNKAIMELRLRQQAGLLDPAARAAAAAAGKRTIFALGARAPVPRVTDAGLDLLEKDLAAIGFFTEEWA